MQGHGERHLVLRAPTGLADALAAEVGIVDPEPAADLLVGLGQRHGLHQVVLHESTLAALLDAADRPDEGGVAVLPLPI